ncbi:hypothetical protein FISHEDRAFT_67630 [Fistulina hepatica ATCC 64428]|nr:hypothetical protein FISHEDRAFT_67630 [Fistulina hepatica ATCC 64428]
MVTVTPFSPPTAIISGFKERIDSLAFQGDRLYIGTSSGNIHVYSLDGEGAGSLVDVRLAVSRKPIEQLAFIKDINSLVVLSDTSVTLYPLPSFSPPTPLVKTKAAFSFQTHSCIERNPAPSSSDDGFAKTAAIPTLRTQLVVGCRRRIVVYSWKDGEPDPVKETTLPHSARTITFLDADRVCLGYTPTDFTIFDIPAMTVLDATFPVVSSTSTTFSGFSGYMTLGLGTKSKPLATRISDEEVLVSKDHEGILISATAKPTRSSSITWPAPPEDLSFVKPYVFASLPAGTIPSGSDFVQTGALQLHSTISTLAPQTFPFPFNISKEPNASDDLPSTDVMSPPQAVAPNTTIRLLTALHSKLFLVTTPVDRTAVLQEGHSVWQFCMKPWAAQLDELVMNGLFSDALAMVETLDETALPDKESRRAVICALNAVSQFREGQYDTAIDTFLGIDLNPAKVMALYPASTAGRLAVPPERWTVLFGGPEQPTSSFEVAESVPQSHVTMNLPTADESRIRSESSSTRASSLPRRTASPTKPTAPDKMHQSVEALVRYLSGRRAKVAAALEAINVDPQSSDVPLLSETSIEDLFALPNTPLSNLTPSQLVRYAQVVDTGLFKSYLFIRPGLLGPLCRRPNWCEVSEVEEELRARKKFGELRDLYNGKKMHAQALNLLRQLSEEEDDLRDKLQPSISYLQRLGPEYLPLIFEHATWIFEADRDMAFEIFTSEDVELPRKSVADFLEGIGLDICAQYIEFLIEERKEESPVFHNRLAQLYLDMTLAAKKRGEAEAGIHAYQRFLEFIDTTAHYQVDVLYALISSEELYEARAILLGRLGRHDQALSLYVYRLQDYKKAEEYCKRIYVPEGKTSGIFLTLLRIYLRPTDRSLPYLLGPALDLVSRHGPRLDPIQTLELLPPLVTAKDVRTFLAASLRSPVMDSRIIRHISKARNEEISHKLVYAQTKRVKITDTRICPNCHKRIGNGVIAVHVPRGEVTHYHCREAFSKKLANDRHALRISAIGL